MCKNLEKIDPNDNPLTEEFLSLQSAPWLTKHIASILALIALILSFGLFFTLVFVPLEPTNKDIIIYILGVLSTIDTQIFSFYFGSSKDSQIKNRLIQRQMLKKQNDS